MADVVPIRPRPESEKITLNLGYVDLGRIDLLVRDGFYTNRTDFIRTAIRHQLHQHNDEAKQSASRLQLELGICHFSRDHLERLENDGKMLDVRVLGLATIAADVTPALARATIRSLIILGALHADPEVKAALADRIS